MGKAYDINIIRDYILANDINEQDVEKLENDVDFMISVIKYTKDRNMFRFCSDKVKKNYDFIKFMIFTFKNDLDFICQLSDDFLKQNDDPLIRIELALIMKKLTENSDKSLKYKVIAQAFYYTSIMDIEGYKSTENNSELLNEIGMGFYFIFDNFNSSDIVMEFFGQQFIDNLLLSKEFDLEAVIHKNFDNFESLEKIGIYKYLLNTIAYYDSMLVSYVSIHTNLLENVIEELQRIKINWNKYEILNERNRYSIIIEQVHDYMQEYELECTFTEVEVLYHIGKELGVAEKIKENDYLDEESFQRIFKHMTINLQTMNFISVRHYYNIKRMISNVLEKRVVKDTYDWFDSKQGKQSKKTLTIDFKSAVQKNNN